jgi:hypothetical protein
VTKSSPFDPGAVEPPWVVFPKLSPDDLPVNQGEAEPWFDQIWRPFWQQLTADQRAAYHAHWKSTDAWRDSIRFFFETIYDLPDD